MGSQIQPSGGSSTPQLPTWSYTSGGDYNDLSPGQFTDDGSDGGPANVGSLYFHVNALNAPAARIGQALLQNILGTGTDPQIGPIIAITTAATVISYVIQAVSMSGENVMVVAVATITNEAYPGSFPAGNYALSFGPNPLAPLVYNAPVILGNIPSFLTTDGRQLVDSGVSFGSPPQWDSLVGVFVDLGSVVTGTFSISDTLGGTVTIYQGVITDWELAD